MRALAALLAALALLLAGAATAQKAPKTRGYAIVGGKWMPVRWAAAFVRTSPASDGGYGIVLADKPLRCQDLSRLPIENRVGQRWALIALFPTKDGFPATGSRTRATMDYPVADAYASLSRGVTLGLEEAAPFPGYVWTGRIDQTKRRVDGKGYAVHATFAARWCA